MSIPPLLTVMENKSSGVHLIYGAGDVGVAKPFRPIEPAWMIGMPISVTRIRHGAALAVFPITADRVGGNHAAGERQVFVALAGNGLWQWIVRRQPIGTQCMIAFPAFAVMIHSGNRSFASQPAS